MKRALIVQGGLAGHEPKETSEVMARALRGHGVEVVISDSIDSFTDPAYTKTFDLLVPHVTGGSATAEQLKGLFEAAEAGVGVAGIHGGGATSFPGMRKINQLIGALFTCHPGGSGTTYTIRIDDHNHPITRGLVDFDITSEQYQLLVDPANEVLASTIVPPELAPMGRPVVMPIAWTRRYGKGRVFYFALGHDAATLSLKPVLEFATRGMLWAAGAL